MVVGILAIQGSRAEHAQMLKRLGVDFSYVRTCEELKDVDALIMPGGESSHIAMSMANSELDTAITKRVESGMPVYGTCAGAILLAKEVTDDEKVGGLGLMDISILRNGYGAQLDSFSTEINVPVLGEEKFEAFFIRAPLVKRVGKNVEVLAEYNGSAILLKEGNMLVSTFHPELTEDTRVHEYFLSMINGQRKV